MGHNWIIDVLADLKSFAQTNGLETLANQLEQTTEVASAEIASEIAKAPLAAVHDNAQTGYVSRKVG